MTCNEERTAAISFLDWSPTTRYYPWNYLKSVPGSWGIKEMLSEPDHIFSKEFIAIPIPSHLDLPLVLTVAEMSFARYMEKLSKSKSVTDVNLIKQIKEKQDEYCEIRNVE